MQSVSRDSYAAAQQRLIERAEVIEDAEVAGPAPAGGDPARAGELSPLGRVGDEIVAFAAVLRREPRLRRALADNTRTGEDRVDLLRVVLRGKVGTGALDLLVTLVGGRWAVPADLLDATERLGVDAILVGAERAADLADVEDELFRFGQIVNGDPRLAAVLGDVTVAVPRRAELVGELLAGKARPATIRLAELAVAGLGGRSFTASLGRLVELAARRRDLRLVYVTVAAPLSEDEQRRLAAALARRYGREVSLKVEVKPEVLGGVRVQIGSDCYDGTIRRRLTDARKALVKQ